MNELNTTKEKNTALTVHVSQEEINNKIMSIDAQITATTDAFAGKANQKYAELRETIVTMGGERVSLTDTPTRISTFFKVLYKLVPTLITIGYAFISVMFVKYGIATGDLPFGLPIMASFAILSTFVAGYISFKVFPWLVEVIASKLINKKWSIINTILVIIILCLI